MLKKGVKGVRELLWSVGAAGVCKVGLCWQGNCGDNTATTGVDASGEDSKPSRTPA
jgi:hypothetical protein